MSDFLPMWKQALLGDVEGLTRALDEEGRDPAVEAERKPGVCGLKRILYGFRDLMCLFQWGTTALHFAAQEGHLPLVEFLLERAPQLIEMRTIVSAAWCVLSALSDSVCVSGWWHSPPLDRLRGSPPRGRVPVQARTSID
jgi:hypothetical protein